MKQDDRIRLRHIADALNAAIRFTAGRRREDLDNDEMLAFALVHALQIVGEAASKVSVEMREELPQIPWPIIISTSYRADDRSSTKRATNNRFTAGPPAA
jgi:uncharacterized protein with HEPN domain